MISGQLLESKHKGVIFGIQRLAGEMDADNSGNLDASDHQNSSREGELLRKVILYLCLQFMLYTHLIIYKDVILKKL